MVNGNGISFSGLASGIDTQSIIQQLMALERIPIQLIETKKAGEQAKLDKVSAFADLVKGLKDAAEKLATESSFFKYAVSNSDPSIASISSTGGAPLGSHSLLVERLASNDRWAFDSVVDPDADLGSADGQGISLTIGATVYDITVDQANSSLEELAAEINNVAGDDVSATVVNAGTDSNPDYRLVIASDDSGEDARITALSTDVAGLSITFSPPDAQGDPTSANNLTVGNNARAVIDGLTVERTDNDFSDVLQGVDITLHSTSGSEPITFSVDADREAIRGSIEEFVKDYNAVVQFINQQSTFTPSSDEDDNGGITGALFGDSILQTVRGNVNRAIFDVDPLDVQNDTEGYSTLSLIGIETNDDGTLEINDTVMDEKMSANLDLFADLFVDYDGFDNGGALPNTPEFYQDTTADSGLAAKLVREIDRMFGSFDGPIDQQTGERMVLDSLFDLKEETIRETISRFDDRIEQMERRLGTFEQILVQRFTRLEELMGALNAQGAALANAFFPPT